MSFYKVEAAFGKMFRKHLYLCSVFQTKIPELEEEPSDMFSPSITIFVLFKQQGPVLESIHLIHSTKKKCYLKLKCVVDTSLGNSKLSMIRAFAYNCVTVVRLSGLHFTLTTQMSLKSAFVCDANADQKLSRYCRDHITRRNIVAERP